MPETSKDGEKPAATADRACQRGQVKSKTSLSKQEILLLLATFLLVYWQTLVWLVKRWFDNPYMGGALIVAPLVAYFIYEKRQQIANLSVRGTAWGWPLLIIAALMHLLSIWIGYPHPSAISLVFLASGLTLSLWGIEVFAKIWAPLAMIIFVTPVPLVLDPVTFPLRILSTKWAAVLPKAAGIPCAVDGTTMLMPGYSLHIDIPCSGLRSVWALFFAAALLSYLFKMNWWKTTILFVAALPIGMLDNILRIDISLVLGNIFGPAAAEGFFHSASGTVCFFITVLILTLIAGTVASWGSKRESRQ